MNRLRICAAALVASASIGLAGCVTDGYGGGYLASGYASYGGDPYYGWYEDYYYPGSGYYIYDRGGRHHRWNDKHRRYWESRRDRTGAHRHGAENWSRYRGQRIDRGQYRTRQRENWQGDRRGHMNRESYRGERQRSAPVDRGGRRNASPQQQPRQEGTRLYLPPGNASPQQQQQQPQQEGTRLYLPPG